MFHTAHETTEQTLTRLIRAWDNRRAVTITYRKADGTETIRTVELFDIRVSHAGDILLVGMDRETREQRSFRLDRVHAYTVHTGAAFTVDRPTTDEPAAAPRPGSLAAAGLQLIDLRLDTTAARVAWLADTLAA